MPNAEDEIRSKTEAFATDIAALVRQMALEAVETALSGGRVAAPPVKVAATPGRPPKKLAAAAPRPVAAQSPPAPKPRGRRLAVWETPKPVSRKPTAPPRSPGEKRPPAELAKLVIRLGDYVKGHPGLRMEAIGEALGLPTRELNLPMKKLLAAKKVRSKGQKRATEYFPA